VTDVQPLVLHCTDGVELEGEWASPEGTARGTVVLCHPHPQYGGTMRSIVISALFDGLPKLGIACLRFNFRGVEGSEGTHSEGRDEPHDVIAAIDAATAGAAAAGIDGPLALVGWSFGADIALGVHDPRIAGWVGIAPPLRFRPQHVYDIVADDERPKLLVLAAHDEFRSPDEIAAETSAWNATRIEVVAGASHFFVGRTERVTTLVGEFALQLVNG
jgi:alpha/beta superfamily hydrolase